MMSYTDQKTIENLKLIEMIASERERASRNFSPFPVLNMLVNHIFVGAIPPEPPGYPSGAHASWGNSPEPPPHLGYIR